MSPSGDVASGAGNSGSGSGGATGAGGACSTGASIAGLGVFKTNFFCSPNKESSSSLPTRELFSLIIRLSFLNA